MVSRRIFLSAVAAGSVLSRAKAARRRAAPARRSSGFGGVSSRQARGAEITLSQACTFTARGASTPAFSSAVQSVIDDPGDGVEYFDQTRSWEGADLV
mgnify:CR=1 FL=1